MGGIHRTCGCGIGVVSTRLDRSPYKALDRLGKGIGLADDLKGSMRLLMASMGGYERYDDQGFKEYR